MSCTQYVLVHVQYSIVQSVVPSFERFIFHEYLLHVIIFYQTSLRRRISMASMLPWKPKIPFLVEITESGSDVRQIDAYRLSTDQLNKQLKTVPSIPLGTLKKEELRNNTGCGIHIILFLHCIFSPVILMCFAFRKRRSSCIPLYQDHRLCRLGIRCLASLCSDLKTVACSTYAYVTPSSVSCNSVRHIKPFVQARFWSNSIITCTTSLYHLYGRSGEYQLSWLWVRSSAMDHPNHSNSTKAINMLYLSPSEIISSKLTNMVEFMKWMSVQDHEERKRIGVILSISLYFLQPM